MYTPHYDYQRFCSEKCKFAYWSHRHPRVKLYDPDTGDLTIKIGVPNAKPNVSPAVAPAGGAKSD